MDHLRCRYRGGPLTPLQRGSARLEKFGRRRSEIISSGRRRCRPVADGRRRISSDSPTGGFLRLPYRGGPLSYARARLYVCAGARMCAMRARAAWTPARRARRGIPLSAVSAPGPPGWRSRLSRDLLDGGAAGIRAGKGRPVAAPRFGKAQT